MELGLEEQKMLDGEFGEAVQESMEILCALGKIYNAEKMIPVSSAQIAGVSYKTIGDAGLEYLEDLAKKGASVKIPSYLNPSGMDNLEWKKMKVPKNFAEKQKKIIDAYVKMGINPTCTCTPYLIGIRPKLKEHIAWSESSAVCFANSVLGARTNREGGPSALASAICGITPYFGLHLKENRISDIKIKIEAELKNSSDFGAMGYFLGSKIKGKTPSFVGIRSAGEDWLKALGAAMAATGSCALFYMEGITPEFILEENSEEIIFEEKDLKEIKEKINSETKNTKPELIAIGCPHASIDEIKKIADILKNKTIGCELWVCTSKIIKEKSRKLGYLDVIERAGGNIVADTCMVVCPIEEIGYKITGVNSGKAAKYLPGFNKQKVIFGDLEEMISNVIR
ncbi:MAG: aconitase X catalytic domain-containing protein [Candidatus Micrarchaeia archaeon]